MRETERAGRRRSAAKIRSMQLAASTRYMVTQDGIFEHRADTIGHAKHTAECWARMDDGDRPAPGDGM